MKKINKKTAFTLTEVLMVLCMLAVIFLLVMITLQQNAKRVETRAKLNVAKSLITQGVIQYQAENLCSGDFSSCEVFNSGASDTENAYEHIFKNKLKTQQDCGMTASHYGCFGKEVYSDADGTKTAFSPDNNGEYYKVRMQNSISFAFKINNKTSCSENGRCAEIIIDTNGPTPPNQLTKDTYTGYITKNQVIFEGVSE